MKELLNFPYRVFKSFRLREISFYSNSFYLMIDSISGALLGFIFWFVAARFFNTESVGLSSALISAISLLAFIAGLGLDDGIIRYLPSASDKGKIFNSVLSLTGIAGVILGIIFILGIPFWSPALMILHRNLVYAAGFTILITAYVYYVMLGAVFVSFKRADFQLFRTLIFQLGKMLIIIGVASVLASFGIIFSFGAAIMLATILGLFYMLPKLIRDYRPVLKIDKNIDKEMIRFALTNYFSGAMWSMPTWILPLIIINVLGATSNAIFFIGWSVGCIATAIPFSISTSVFAEGSNQIESMRKNLKKGVKLIILLLIPSEIILFIFAHYILSLFGRVYASGGTVTLRLIALCAIPLSVTLLYLAVVQVEKRLLQIIFVSGGSAVGILVSSYVFVKMFGINGAAIACLLTYTVIAIGVAPFLLKYLIGKQLLL